MIKKIIAWAVVILVVYFVATKPSGAAGFVHSAYNGLRSASVSFASFVNSL